METKMSSSRCQWAIDSPSWISSGLSTEGTRYWWVVRIVRMKYVQRVKIDSDLEPWGSSKGNREAFHLQRRLAPLFIRRAFWIASESYSRFRFEFKKNEKGSAFWISSLTLWRAKSAESRIPALNSFHLTKARNFHFRFSSFPSWDLRSKMR